MEDVSLILIEYEISVGLCKGGGSSVATFSQVEMLGIYHRKIVYLILF